MGRIHVTQIVGNSEGGGTQIVAALLEALDPRQFALTLVAPDAPHLADLCHRTGVDFAPLPLLERRTNGAVRGALRDLLARTRPHIVHAHGTRAAWFARGALARTGPALIYSEHLFSYHARTGLARLPWLAIERTLCRRADVLTTSCAANADDVLARGWIAPERVPLRHYGIDLAAIRAQAERALPRAALGIADDVPIIGTVGRLIPQKGIGDLLEAAARVLAFDPRTLFLIVGDGELRGELEARSAALGIAEQVRFLGRQRRPWELLAVCDVIALPSLYEGLPLTALEALAVGLPVVATPVGGTAEVVRDGETGLLVPPRDPAALALALLKLLTAPQRRAALGQAAQAAVAPYDLSETLAAFARLYERVAQPAQTRAGERALATRPVLAGHTVPHWSAPW